MPILILQLEEKFGKVTARTRTKIKKIECMERLEALLRTVLTAESVAGLDI